MRHSRERGNPVIPSFTNRVPPITGLPGQAGQ
jgi:hypothetical protein